METIAGLKAIEPEELSSPMLRYGRFARSSAAVGARGWRVNQL